MKNIFAILACLVLAYSCSKDDDQITDPDTDTEQSTDTVYVALTGLSTSAYPSTANNWIVVDKTATSSSFMGLSNALIDLAGTGRKISLEFPYLESVPDEALTSCSALESVSLPIATSVGSYAFQNCTQLKTAYLPKVTSVGSSAFSGCSTATTISMASVVDVADSVFYNCNALTSISMLSAVNVGNHAFASCGAIKKITLTAAQTVGEGAFKNCLSLASIDLSSVVTLGKEAFSSCTSLSTIYLPKATSIGEGAFLSCASLTVANFPILDTLASSTFYVCQSMTKVNIPAVSVIGASAFGLCSSLEEVYYSSDVITTIAESAFLGCKSLTTFTIGSSVNNIGTGAFSGCDNLTDLNVESPNFAFEDGILYDADRTTVLTAFKAIVSGDLVLPNTVTTIGDYSFAYCDNLNSIVFAGVTSLSETAFDNCSALSSITLPAQLSSITGRLFYLCENLTNINADSNDNYVFDGCVLYNSTKTTVVATLGAVVSGDLVLASVTSIGDYGFAACDKLSSIYIPKVTSIGAHAFNGCDGLRTLYVAISSGVVLSYVDANAIGDDADSIVLYIGSSNSSNVSDDVLTVGNFSQEFSRIYLM